MSETFLQAIKLNCAANFIIYFEEGASQEKGTK